MTILKIHYHAALSAFYGVFLPYATYPVDLGRYGQSTMPRWQHHKRMMQEYMVSVGSVIRLDE